ncbi:peptidase [Methanobrevibacter sp. 87.7]|uniref:zinc metalloprotease HtpX n=1 Tax=Methanobrevibacter sp. 87.7 TaxID=387957 RepID=UPI000B50FFBA|nr:zinc metalloprotease HtpX [Methanobrevibacter sp. 87.7]OWT33073.1 peptidase [Methanobrevibacter sp. 87.7]
MKGTWKLHLRMAVASILMFVILYFIVGLVCTIIGINMAPMVWLAISLVITFIQFLAGPKLVEWSMGVRRVSESEAPELHQMVAELAANAGIPKPTVGICNMSVPNAFAYSRTRRDGHIAVTTGILNVLNHDELKAVLGHEMSHIKHYDCAINTIISVIPMICYYTAISFLYSNDNDNGLGIIIGIVGLVFYFIGQLLVLFVSRIREYYADQGSVELGNKPEWLSSALYKLVYGAASAPEKEIKEFEGNRAFFLNDVSHAEKDITELSQIDLNGDGVIGAEELRQLKNSNVKVSTGNNFMELFSTHPDMLKRIKRLSELEN